MLPALLLRTLSTSVLLTLSFPRPDAGPLVLVALVPLLSFLPERKITGAFLSGWTAGFFWFFFSYNWVAHSISHFGEVPFPLDMGVIVLLAGVHALFIGAFAALAQRIGRPSGSMDMLLLASVWVLLELARSWFPAPFPWLLLGTGVWKTVPLRPLFPLVGVYGASFYILLFNVTVWRIAGGGKTGKMPPFFILAILILSPLIGVMTSRTGPGEPVRVGVVQGNFQQDLKWDEQMQDETARVYLNLTEDAVKRGARLIVWPETAVPVFYQAEPELAETLRGFVREKGIHLVFGSPGYEILGQEVRLYNRAYHLGPDGREEHYDKIRLVPFGEYVPLSALLPFVDKLVPGEGEFARGKWEGPFTTPVPSGLLICYEVAFPSLVRREVLDGSRFLINVTNDAWFGRSWGPYQHLSVAAVRAAENGVPLVRAANTGISAVIDRTGRIREAVPLDTRGVIVTEIETGGGMTPYTRFGDWIVMFAFAVITIKGFKIIFKWRSRKWNGSMYSETP